MIEVIAAALIQIAVITSGTDATTTETQTDTQTTTETTTPIGNNGWGDDNS